MKAEVLVLEPIKYDTVKQLRVYYGLYRNTILFSLIFSLLKTKTKDREYDENIIFLSFFLIFGL